MELVEKKEIPAGNALNLPKGYKKTEIGSIPEDWEYTELDKLADFLDGQRRPIKAGERIKGNIPYYGASGIIDYVQDYIFDDDLILLGEDGENIISRNLPLAFVVSGKSWVNNHAHVIKPKSEVNIHFLTAYLESLDYTLLNSGTAQPKLNKQSCLKIKVVKPTLAEQEAIATALSDVDAAISALDQLIAKKKNIKQGAMQELLTGKTRVKGFETNLGFKKTEVGDIPEDWTVHFLKEFVDENRSIRYGIVQPGKYDPKGKFLIRGQDYSFGWVDSNHFFRVSPEIEVPYKNARVKEGDLIMTIVGAGTGHIEQIPEWLNEANLTQTTARIAINPLLGFAPFFKHYFRSYYGKDQIKNFIKGAAQPGLNCGDIEKFKIPLPPSLAEQAAIANILSDMDNEIEQLQSKKVKYQQLKQGMMQELLTGKTRLV